MRRSMTLACLSPFVLASAALAAPVQDADRFAKVEIKVTPVAGSVYVLEGAGGNIAVSVGEDGIVIVDDQYAPLVEKIRAALRGLTSKPVRFVLNTHYHGDHTGGNALLQKDAPVIAHDNVSNGGDFVSTDKWLETLVNELKGGPPGAFVKHD